MDTSLVFSTHAKYRMEQRGLHLVEYEMSKLEHAVDLAQNKGAIDACILYGETSFIIHVPKRMVVTVMAVRGESTVITNIDTTIVVGHAEGIL